jgi:hypothetical protein
MNFQEIESLTPATASRIALIAKDKNGLVCKKCGSTEHYLLKTKDQHQCKVCRFRTTVKSGTAMQHSKLSVKQWLIACWYLSKQAKSVSGVRLQELLDMKNYRSIHLLLVKIRNVMSKSQIRTVGEELDKFYKISLKLSIRGTFGEPTECMIANYPDESGRYRIHLIAMEDLQKHQPQKNAAKGKARSHPWKLEDFNSLPVIELGDASGWFKKHISNLQRSLNGVHNGVTIPYRQLHFDEFSYRTNLRMAKKNVFECLLNDILSGNWFA